MKDIVDMEKFTNLKICMLSLEFFKTEIIIINVSDSWALNFV